MWQKIKSLAKRILGRNLTLKMSSAYRNRFHDFSSKTWGQNAEDAIIDAYFNANNGFYVDIGAHHPKRYSNTYRLYLRGWRGLAIDPLPGLDALFRAVRPEDLFLNIGVGPQKESLTYYDFSDPAVNTFVEFQADQIMKAGEHKLKRKLSVEILPVKDVLSRYIRGSIDVVSIDAEGMDEAILGAWPFESFRPKMFVVESLKHAKGFSAVPEVLRAQGYQYYARSGWSYFYVLD